MNQSILEEMNIDFHKEGEYFIPNLSLEDDGEDYHIGVWGQRYGRHLQEHHRIIYYNYLTKGELYQHLVEVDKRAEYLFNQTVKSLAENENVTEKLKADDIMMWVQKMNNIRNRAIEIVNEEVIFV